MPVIAVVGVGYVGLVSGAGFATLGHKVICLDIAKEKLSRLRCGEMPFYEPGLEEMVLKHQASGRITFTDDYTSAIPASDFALLAVDTPSRSDGSADTSSVFTAARGVLQHARRGLILVLKSTVPPGTGEAVAQMAQEMAAHVEVVSNPEFLRQGSAVRDFLEPDRIVIGGSTVAATEAVADLYARLGAPVVRCSRRSAELAKYAANALLATRVSYINEIAGICEAIGADVDDVARIVGMDPRIGSRYLQAGLGWGGSCLPKDVNALRAIAADHGAASSMIEAAANINGRQRELMIEKLVAGLGSLDGKRIAILGLAFKPHTDDTRDAPALQIIRRLLQLGARVAAHDPFAMEATKRVLRDVEYCPDPLTAARGSDAVLLATEWPEYLALDWKQVGRIMRNRFIVDGRNALDPAALEACGFIYAAFGRPRGEHRLAVSPNGRAVGESPRL